MQEILHLHNFFFFSSEILCSKFLNYFHKPSNISLELQQASCQYARFRLQPWRSWDTRSSGMLHGLLVSACLRMGPTGCPRSRYNKRKRMMSNILEERRFSRWHTVFTTQNTSVGGFTGAPLPQGWLCLCSGQSHFSYLLKGYLCPSSVITSTQIITLWP
jgi:hypothetical protein